MEWVYAEKERNKKCDEGFLGNEIDHPEGKNTVAQVENQVC